MTSTYASIRNKALHGIYKGLLKPVFFMNDPEVVHDQMTRVGIRLGAHPWTRAMTAGMFEYENEMLRQNILGLDFRNPVGLSAGFDKDAQLTDILPAVGFGFAEAGSITGEPCSGNPKPRLWRLPKSKGLVVYYGLKNEGCESIAERLKAKIERQECVNAKNSAGNRAVEKNPDMSDGQAVSGALSSIPIGVSVAMTNCRDNLDTDKAIADFAKAFRVMEPFGSYITVNISCPNTENGQPFIQAENLEQLFDVLDRIPTVKPIFIKLSPDLSRMELDGILDVARRHRIQGIITTNLTKKRDNPKILDADVPEKGGVSGKAVQKMSDDALAYIYKREGDRFTLVGTGGIFTAEDAYKKIRLGASLVQLITGMIFEGPQVVGEINRGLAELLKKDGFTDISQAIGADNC